MRDSLDSGFLMAQGARTRLQHSRSYPGLQAIKRCEPYLLHKLCWDLNTVTPLHFVLNHLYQGVVFSNDETIVAPGSAPSTDKAAVVDPSDRKLLQKVRRHVDYFALQAIKQDFMLTKKFTDQTVAAAIIFAARLASKVLRTPWNAPAF